MKIFINYVILITLLCALPFAGKAQGNWVVKFDSPENEGAGDFIENSNGYFIGIISKHNSNTDKYEPYFYKININGDTLYSKKYIKSGTNSFTHIIQSDTNPVEYLVCGYEMRNGIFDFFIKTDSTFNTIWEKTYRLCPPDISSSFEYKQQFLKKKDSGYVFATLYDNGGNQRLVFFEIDENGDSVAYRAYAGDSAGRGLHDLYYNHDSSAYMVNVYHTHYIPYWGETQILTIDFDFNQTTVTYLPRWHEAITSRVLPGGSIVSGGIYDGYILNPYQHLKQICALKYYTLMTLTDSTYFTNPDAEIGKREGYYRSIDYYYPNSIFVAGTYDYDVGIWVPHPSWIAIAKMDSNLNLLTEKYIGGDAFYLLSDIVATSDGGLLISTSRYDYNSQIQEHDGYIFKLDSLDLLVGNYEHKTGKQVKNAIVYPNPTRNKTTIYVRTAVQDARFVLYDLNGRKIKTVILNKQSLVTPVTISGLPAGNYVWRVIKQNKQIETGKLLIIN